VPPDLPFWTPYLFGALGSLAVDLYEAQVCYRRGRFPSRYSRLGYYAVRTGFACLSAMIVLGYGVENPIVAFHLGAATPVLIQEFSRRPPTPKLDP
jgi:hypothetical protein